MEYTGDFKISSLGDEILLVGGIPLGNRAGCATSEQALYRLLRFLLRNRSALMPLLLKVNWRKVPREAALRSHSQHGCDAQAKGSHDLRLFDKSPAYTQPRQKTKQVTVSCSVFENVTFHCLMRRAIWHIITPCKGGRRICFVKT